MTRAVALLAVLVLAGCGGSPAPRVARPPHIPRALAHAWETQAEAVAQSLSAGDGCTALAQANALRDSVARSQMRVPLRLRTQLTSVVQQLPGRITCTPPAPAPPPHDHGHGRGHGHGPGDGGDHG